MRNTLLAAALIGVAGLPFSGPAQAESLDSVKMTWFGITNWYYEFGDVGVLVDGAVSDFTKEPAVSDPALVERVYKALDKGAGVDKIFIGHEHGDHSIDAVAWSEVTGAPIYTSKVACDAAVAKGLPEDMCHPVYGGETIDVSETTKVHVVRWSHSFRCDASSEGGIKGIETFGFLFTTETTEGKIAWFISDSGAGGPELVTNRIVDGVDYGAPLGNLVKAVRDAGVDGFPLWQGGPESRVVNQARVLLPVFNVKTFMPQHFGARGGYNILDGLHYAYDPDEMPKMQKVLKDYGASSLFPINYFDAYDYSAAGVTPIENAEVKAAMGLPAQGPGPIEQGPNPRSGQLECTQD